eukprot:6198817-Pleurochrysis_carterae.AAC.3
MKQRHTPAAIAPKAFVWIASSASAALARAAAGGWRSKAPGAGERSNARVSTFCTAASAPSSTSSTASWRLAAQSSWQRASAARSVRGCAFESAMWPRSTRSIRGQRATLSASSSEWSAQRQRSPSSCADACGLRSPTSSK